MVQKLLIALCISALPLLAQDGPFQVRYASNLTIGDSVINITNDGFLGAALPSGTGASVTGAICANVYAFSPDEQMIACCTCPVTPNGLVSLSAQRDLISNTLTPATPDSIVIKLLASTPQNGTCNAAAPVGDTPGMIAWGTTIHEGPTVVYEATERTEGSGYEVTETPFVNGRLSAGERNRLTQLCTFIQANGSGFGICESCQLGGLLAR